MKATTLTAIVMALALTAGAHPLAQPWTAPEGQQPASAFAGPLSPSPVPIPPATAGGTPTPTQTPAPAVAATIVGAEIAAPAPVASSAQLPWPVAGPRVPEPELERAARSAPNDPAWREAVAAGVVPADRSVVKGTAPLPAPEPVSAGAVDAVLHLGAASMKDGASVSDAVAAAVADVLKVPADAVSAGPAAAAAPTPAPGTEARRRLRQEGAAAAAAAPAPSAPTPLGDVAVRVQAPPGESLADIETRLARVAASGELARALAARGVAVPPGAVGTDAARAAPAWTLPVPLWALGVAAGASAILVLSIAISLCVCVRRRRAAKAATARAAAKDAELGAARAILPAAEGDDGRVTSTIQMLRDYAGELSVQAPAGAPRPRVRSAAQQPSSSSARSHLPQPTAADRGAPLSAADLTARLDAANARLSAFVGGLTVKSAAPLVASVLASARARRAAAAAPEPGSEDAGVLHAVARALLDRGAVRGRAVDAATVATATTVAAVLRASDGGDAAGATLYVDQREFASATRFLDAARGARGVAAALDAWDADAAGGAAGGAGLGPGAPSLAGVVTERGRHSVAEWLARARGAPPAAAKAALVNALEAVAALHSRGVVHRDIRPATLRWHDGDGGRWKLGVPGGRWARAGGEGPLDYSLRHAAPELVAADAAAAAGRMAGDVGAGRALSVAEAPAAAVADPATDMWAVGVLAWELLTGRPLFGDSYSDEQVGRGREGGEGGGGLWRRLFEEWC
jgi:hypothetical protein